MKLFRDLGSKKHVEAFYKNGELQISTLFNFRNLENQDRMDKSEAVKSYRDYLNPKEFDPRFNIPIQIIDQKGKIIQDVGYYRKIEVANCFALSFFQENKFPETSIVVKDVKQFSNIIGEELNNRFILGAEIHRPCLYYESGDERCDIISLNKETFLSVHKNPILTAFLKDKKKYGDDNEYRMLWIPYYQKKASVKVLDRIRKYGFKFQDNYSYWPEYSEFPTYNEMIKNKEKITNRKLLHCVE